MKTPHKKGLDKITRLATADNYKRMLNAEFIERRKSNSKIPPFTESQKRVMKDHLKSSPEIVSFLLNPTGHAILRVKNPAKVREAARPMGLQGYVRGRSLIVKRLGWERAYFNERTFTVSIYNDLEGTKKIIPFADWDILVLSGAVPHFKHTRLSKDAETGIKAKIKDDAGNTLHFDADIAVLDSNTWRKSGDLWTRGDYLKEGHAYKLEVLNTQNAGNRGIFFTQYLDTSAEWGSKEQTAMRAREKRISTTNEISRR